MKRPATRKKFRSAPKLRNHRDPIPEGYHGHYRHLVSLDEEGIPKILHIIDQGMLLNTEGLKLEWLNEDILTRRTPNGETAMHAAANKGHLKDLPPHLLTTYTLTIRDKCQSTPFHCAARSGHLDQIPREHWNEAFIFDQTHGCSVVHYASLSKATEQFPLDLDVRKKFRENFSRNWWRRHLAVLKKRERMRKQSEEEARLIEPCRVAVKLD